MKLIKYCNQQTGESWPFEPLFGSALRELSAIEPMFDRTPNLPKEATRRPVLCNEGENGYDLRMELPGFSKKEVLVEIDQTLLKVSVGRKDVERGEAQNEITRTIRLPEGIDQGKSKASLENGVLTVHLPKKAPRKPLNLKVS